MRARIVALDHELLAMQTTREAALDPLQLGQVLTQRQLLSCAAAAAAAAAEVAAEAAVVKFDKDAKDADDQYVALIRHTVALQEAAKASFTADRVTFVADLTKGTQAAHAKAAEAKRFLDAAQKTHAHQTGAAQAEAGVALAKQQADVERQAAANRVHFEQQDVLRQQLATQTAQLNDQAAQLAMQQTALRPAALTPVAVLPTPMMPEAADSAEAMYSLRASLHQLAEQEMPVLVTWADLATAHLHWADTCKLVPFHVMEASLNGTDATNGPTADSVVPRRILELLRKQLDAVVIEWIKDNTAKAAVAEQKHGLSAWAQTVLSQAKRLQELKRSAAPSDEPPTSKAKLAEEPQPPAEVAA